jgi:hypothetical protein
MVCEGLFADEILASLFARIITDERNGKVLVVLII